MSPSGRTVLYYAMNIIVFGHIFHSEISQKGITIQNAIAALNSVGQEFLYTENGNTIIQVLPASSGININNNVPVSNGTQYYDSGFGPAGYCHILKNNPASTQIEFILTVKVAPQASMNILPVQANLPGAQTQNQVNIGGGVEIIGNQALGNSIIDNIIDVSYQYDVSGYLTRVISGALVVSGAYGTWFDLDNGVDSYRIAALNANRFLGNSVLEPPPYFVRVNQMFNPTADGLTLRYQIVDRQRSWCPPAPCTDYDVTIEVDDKDHYQLGMVYKSLVCDFEFPGETSQIGNSATAVNTSGAAMNATFAACIAVQQQTILNFIYSDPNPQTLEYITKVKMRRVSMQRNRWRLEVEAIHISSLVYTGGLQNVGLWSTPPNTSGEYPFPPPYGYTGDFGTGYMTGRNQDLGLIGGSTGGFGNNGNPNNSQSITGGAASTESGLILHKEHTTVSYAYEPFVFPATGTTSQYAGGTSNVAKAIKVEVPVVTWCGYKARVGSWPTIPSPMTYFNIVTSFTPNTPLNVTTNNGKNKYDAIILSHKVTNETPITARWGNEKLYITKYAFSVLLSPSLVGQLNLGSTLTAMLAQNYNAVPTSQSQPIASNLPPNASGAGGNNNSLTPATPPPATITSTSGY